ncbi:fumarylacetoacetate hydrolase family protein [Gracilibacillus salinarum]|uniref:Fumarylacetoacetate hydrolase family protein n=1 Tax=Gracilibacillus salinarum TaxID=2932255 RepID=A0ABY4GJJ3_9BACI|nr:fumarylacetoacetate hydrolase family protein [Gracilibacillus salinarum]UOQ84170.1 fumarylacetoacetate hydrolase family protein [Gracilibacillus salinarum]
MKLATVLHEGEEKAVIVQNEQYYLIESLNDMENTDWPSGILEMIEGDHLDKLKKWYEEKGRTLLEKCHAIDKDTIRPAPLYRKPRKIWGIGMNYITPSQGKLEGIPYSDPVSFMKPDTTIIGPGDVIQIPKGSTNTTAEAELAIIIGQTCRHVEPEDARHYIAGYAIALDMTESDIHAENHRYLTRAKSFDTFFSFGSEFVTADEWPEVGQMEVETYHNDQLVARNQVRNMRYSPSFIVSFHSKVMTLLPGDIILTGTPGKVIIRDQDTIEARINGFKPLINVVEQ